MVKERNPGQMGAEANVRQLQEDVNDLKAKLQELEEQDVCEIKIEDFNSLEERLAVLTDELAAKIQTLKQQQKILSKEFKKKEEEYLAINNLRKSYQSDGYRPILFQPSQGPKQTLYVRRWRKVKKEQQGRTGGRPRKKERRAGKGLTIAAILFGLFAQMSPLAAHKVARMGAVCSSFAEATIELEWMGLKLSEDTVKRVVYAYAQMARTGMDMSGREDGQPVDFKGKRTYLSGVGNGKCIHFKGKRAYLSVDGGRIRERVTKKRKKGKKGGKCYDRPWREPKVFIFMLLDEAGERESDFPPIIDGAIQDADACFDLLIGHLKNYDLKDLESLLVIADGAHWIWNRVANVKKELGLEKVKVYEVLDWYHVAERVGELLGKIKTKTKKEQQKLIKKLLKHLKEGEKKEFLAELKKLRKHRGQNRKQVIEDINYLENNLKAERMNYKEMREKKLPIGSGAMESTIRMVINLRLKGCGKFWIEENANHVILLRCYWKSGRFDELKAFVHKAQQVIPYSH